MKGICSTTRRMGNPVPEKYRKKCRRYDVSGDAHFITFSCFHRLPLLSRDRSRRFFVEAIQRAQLKGMFDLWVYVIMPEHVHLILRPQSNIKISAILSSVKQSTSKRAITWLMRNAPDFLRRIEDVSDEGESTYRFWQRGGGYDRNLRSARDVHEKIRYIHENPVRRGLVADPLDWYWSSAAAWATDKDEPLTIQRDDVPRLTSLEDDLLSGLLR